MPTNPNATIARFNEVAATACAEQTLHQLHSLACAPSGKVYARQREQRLALWKQLREVAEVQVAALSVATSPRKKPASAVLVDSPLPVSFEAMQQANKTDMVARAHQACGIPPVEPTAAKE